MVLNVQHAHSTALAASLETNEEGLRWRQTVCRAGDQRLFSPSAFCTAFDQHVETSRGVHMYKREYHWIKYAINFVEISIGVAYGVYSYRIVRYCKQWITIILC